MQTCEKRWCYGFDKADVFLHERPRVEAGRLEQRDDVPQRLGVADVDVGGRRGGKTSQQTEALSAMQQLLVLKRESTFKVKSEYMYMYLWNGKN